jgi:hypothetical protein
MEGKREGKGKRQGKMEGEEVSLCAMSQTLYIPCKRNSDTHLVSGM